MHFEKCISKKGRLKKSAIPSLHLSEKPLQHDSSTQIVEKCSMTTNIQAECCLPYDIKQINIKEEKTTDAQVEESQSVVQGKEMKTENDNDDDENSDSEAFEDVEIKTEIVENEILPLLQAMHSLKSVDLKINKDGESAQPKNLLQESDEGLTAPIVNRTGTTPTMPISKKRKMDESIQTDRVIVLSQNTDGSEVTVNPEECKCNRNDYLDMTRPQFYRSCSKFLSANFAINVKRRMHLDDVIKQGGNKLSEAGSSGRVIAGAAECIEMKLNAPGCEGVVAPDVAIAIAETAANLYAVDSVEATAAPSAADSATSTHLTELGKNQSPEVPTLLNCAVELTNTPQVSTRPKQKLYQSKHVGRLKRVAACYLDVEDCRRFHRVSQRQLKKLCEFLNSNRDVAAAHTRHLQAKQEQKWREIAEVLNSQGDGAHKDWVGWSKYWVGYKLNLKKRVAAIRASQVRTPVRTWPSTVSATRKPLTEIEEKFLLMLEDDFGQGTPAVRVEPPSEIVAATIDSGVQDSSASESILHDSQSVLDPPFLTPVQNLPAEPEPILEPLPQNLPAEPEPILEPLPKNPPLELMVQDPPARSPSRTPTRSPHPATTSAVRSPRRRRLRRKPSMSQEAASRALVRSTRMHAEAAVRTAEAMEKTVLILGEFRETARRIERILNAAFPTIADQENS